MKEVIGVNDLLYIHSVADIVIMILENAEEEDRRDTRHGLMIFTRDTHPIEETEGTLVEYRYCKEY